MKPDVPNTCPVGVKSSLICPKWKRLELNREMKQEITRPTETATKADQKSMAKRMTQSTPIFIPLEEEKTKDRWMETTANGLYSAQTVCSLPERKEVDDLVSMETGRERTNDVLVVKNLFLLQDLKQTNKSQLYS